MENNLETLRHLLTKDVRIVLELQDQRNKRREAHSISLVILAHDSLLLGDKLLLLRYHCWGAESGGKGMPCRFSCTQESGHSCVIAKQFHYIPPKVWR